MDGIKTAQTPAPPTPQVQLPAPGDSAVVWPRSVQYGLVCLIAIALTLLGVQAAQLTRWGTQAAELTPSQPYRVDLNHASRAELLNLPGIGPTLADRILEQRAQQGRFRSVEELRQVAGVGPVALERLRPWVSVQPQDEAATPPRGQQEKPPTAAPGKVALTKKAQHLLEAGKRIDINRATLAELQMLPGIGPKLSQRIADERAKKQFAQVDELRRVSGIGAKTLDKLRPFITAEP